MTKADRPKADQPKSAAEVQAIVDGTGSFAIARAAGFRMLVMSRIRHVP